MVIFICHRCVITQHFCINNARQNYKMGFHFIFAKHFGSNVTAGFIRYNRQAVFHFPAKAASLKFICITAGAEA